MEDLNNDEIGYTVKLTPVIKKKYYFLNFQHELFYSDKSIKADRRLATDKEHIRCAGFISEKNRIVYMLHLITNNPNDKISIEEFNKQWTIKY